LLKNAISAVQPRAGKVEGTPSFLLMGISLKWLTSPFADSGGHECWQFLVGVVVREGRLRGRDQRQLEFFHTNEW
jgi:hypothetical protein